MLKTGMLNPIISGLLTMLFASAFMAKANAEAPFIVLEASPDGPRIKYSDAQGKLQTLYRLKRGSQLFQFSHAKGRPELVLAYAPSRTGQQGIWRLEYTLKPGKKATVRLTPVLTDDDPKSWFFDPIYNAAQDQIYFVSAKVDKAEQRASKDLALKLFDIKTGESQLIANQASHPAISETGQFLLWQQQTNQQTQLAIQSQSQTNPILFQVNSKPLKLHFPVISESQKSLYFLSTEASLFTGIPGLSRAFAHPGSQHQDYFLWQLPLNATDFKQAQLLWQSQEVRGIDITADGNSIGIVDDHGIQLFHPESGNITPLISGRHFWKFSWVK